MKYDSYIGAIAEDHFLAGDFEDFILMPSRILLVLRIARVADNIYKTLLALLKVDIHCRKVVKKLYL